MCEVDSDRKEAQVAETIGFIGLGVMGKPMALNLIKAGFSVVAHNRSRGPVDELTAAGAKPADSAADATEQSTVVITMLPDTADVEKVLTAADGVLSTLQRGALVVDMSSISPTATERLASLEVNKHLTHDPTCGAELWFHPLASVDNATVGVADAHAFTGASLGTKWSDPNKRSAFFGTFSY